MSRFVLAAVRRPACPDCISEDAMKNLMASTLTSACDLLHLSEE